MTPDAYLTALENDGERICEVAGRDLDAPVPPCPGWTVRDAVLHTGEVYSHKVACMRLGRRPEVDEWLHGPEPGRPVEEWYHERLHELVGELTKRRPDDPTFTWYPPEQNVRFWMRRMAQETAVHRVDVESAFDEITPVDNDLAVDGIDEVLTRFLVFDAESAGTAGSGTVAVRTGDHWWRVHLLSDTTTLDEGPGDSDATVSGDPSELLLWLWGRRPDQAVQREGNEAAIRGLRERLVGATQ